MKEATLVTAKFESILVHSRDDFYRFRQYTADKINYLIERESGDIATPLEGISFNDVNIPIKRFCKEETPDINMTFIPPEYRNIKEWYIAMDPMLQEFFDMELSALHSNVEVANHRALVEAERANHYKSEIDRIKGMSAWDTAKVAWAKLWSRK